MNEAACEKGFSLLMSLRNRVTSLTESLQRTHGSFSALADKAFGELPPPPPSTNLGSIATTPASQYEGEAGDLERAMSELESVTAQVGELVYRFSRPLD